MKGCSRRSRLLLILAIVVLTTLASSLRHAGRSADGAVLRLAAEGDAGPGPHPLNDTTNETQLQLLKFLFAAGAVGGIALYMVLGFKRQTGLK